uniref:Cytochrome P450 2D26-like n=1 Tax=Saccoglossus kowalevskii TaxID=10224 RepID=A0ABM0M5C3_SACKO|nr:PREDICTED: cytochrome P450 2D26-like [Saccoglossus kowalevskii]
MIIHTSEIAGSTTVVNFLPILRYIPRYNVVDKYCDTINSIIDWIQLNIDEHSKHFAVNSEPRDFVDAYLAELKSRKKKQSTSVDNNNLIRTVVDLFAAGTETTSTALSWSILYSALYPDIQSRLRQEILDEIGQSRDVTMADRHKLPYTEDVIVEVNRISSIVHCLYLMSSPMMSQWEISLFRKVR